MEVQLKNVRMAFANIFKPKSVQGSDPKYSAAFLMSPDSKNTSALEAAIEQVAEEKWGKKAPEVLRELRKKDRVCLREGDDKKNYDGFEGMMYLSASNSVRPNVFDRDGSELSSADGRPYSGCYVYAIVDVWAQDSEFGKRINASLKGVKFFKDGDAFTGGGVSSASDFDDLGDIDDDDDDDLA